MHAITSHVGNIVQVLQIYIVGKEEVTLLFKFNMSFKHLFTNTNVLYKV